VNVFSVKLAYEDGGTKKEVFVVASDGERTSNRAECEGGGRLRLGGSDLLQAHGHRRHRG
jgi:hypothetical protein